MPPSTSGQDLAQQLAQTQRLLDMTIRLTHATVPSDVLSALSDEAPKVLGASLADVSLLDVRARTFHLVAAAGTPDKVASDFDSYPLDAPLPSRDAVLENRPVYLHSISERDERYPALAGVEVREKSFAILPMVANRTCLGVVGFGWPDERSFSPGDRAVLELIAELCSSALERTRLFQAEHDIAEALQRALLPGHLPRVAGVELELRYLPSGQTAQVGGDWYDALELPHDRVGVAVGDVAGHGVTAAARMGQLRQSLRDRARPGAQAHSVLRQLNRTAVEIGADDLLATCCYVTVEPRKGRLSWANAGHLPPVLAIGDRVGLLDNGRPTEPPLATLPDLTYRLRRRSIELPMRLVLYTDGLVERRDTSIDQSLAQLVQAVREGPTPAPELCEYLLDRFDVEQAGDDLTILIADIDKRTVA